ncbi:MAG TPA: succinyl-diaminopimelate desuccinylase [Pseudomonadales bacterium]|nr:succinyl-diaminopimelate desuccinylase [Pseudomonadales bacterium]
MDVLALSQQLIRCASVTPNDDGCQDLLIAHLERLGFEVTRLPFGNVANFWARRGTTAPLVAFAGHTDVVPTGPPEQWTSPPFEPVIRDAKLFGRGAADMKTALAAMVVAIDRLLAEKPDCGGSIALLVTSDEEGDAVDGTVKVIEHLQRHGTHIDYCVVGEPSSDRRVGDMVRVGRRGSLNGRAHIRGIQGHVAYPEKVRNPIHMAAPAMAELAGNRWDNGNAYFPATTFQISNVHAGTGATNVVPGMLELLFNFRFNTEQTPERLQAAVADVFARHRIDAHVTWTLSGLPFLTPRGRLVDAVCASIRQATRAEPELSTGGGTSDGRFIAPTGTEVIEVGVVNETIHSIDECVAVSDVTTLVDIYAGILRRLLPN